ncbi:uncharacterized protein EI90DRAFT_3279460, partial [Cantharellus anzutake]|uniref:uncharacterized protein n=1 Tax=Cantharellus anzutake TaxID=1750568 RepID=UPI0019060773
MRFLSQASLLSLSLLSVFVSAQDAEGIVKKSFGYQSDVARLRKIVINSLYSHRDVFLRELISNANDALEKLRITSLKEGFHIENPMNISIKAVKEDQDGKSRLVVTDFGIGMSAEELATNLGTLAKSGTSEFLTKAETDSSSANSLIGQFGVGFYSAFLVADQVYVASLPGPTKENPDPTQNVFLSSSEGTDFTVYPDPRGNTLGRGTEITLIMRSDATEYLDIETLKSLVQKHSAFTTSYPIYLHHFKTEEVPDLDAVIEQPKEEEPVKDTEDDEDSIEDVVEGTTEPTEEKPLTVPMKNVTTEEWVHLNDQPPLWQRDPKNVSKTEYDDFFRSTFKDPNDPLAVHHFKGDAGSVSFKALLFIPPNLDTEFWQSSKIAAGSLKLMVKRVFITSDFGDASLPKWISWLRAVVDADDLPLNVSRETLQSGRFLSRIKNVLVSRTISLLARVSEEDPEQYAKIMDVFGPTFKLGAVESQKDRQKIASLTRWNTNLRNSTSLDEYVAKKKKGQNQIFFLAAAGSDPGTLKKSVFIEKLHARGYEVILAHESIDEILISNLRQWKGLVFQDVSKKGLTFGDEDQSPEEEKAELQVEAEKYKPLLSLIKEKATGIVKDVVISNRLVTSACAIVADQFGYSANMEKLMASQQKRNKEDQDIMHDWAKKQRVLEINPRSPLIEGLLKKVEKINDVAEGGETDSDLQAEVTEVISILIDSALVRSGFAVENSNEFFTRIDRVLRRSLGVSEHAPTDTTVKPAPDVDDSVKIDPDATKKLAAQLDEDEK